MCNVREETLAQAEPRVEGAMRCWLYTLKFDVRRRQLELSCEKLRILFNILCFVLQLDLPDQFGYSFEVYQNQKKNLFVLKLSRKLLLTIWGFGNEILRMSRRKTYEVWG